MRFRDFLKQYRKISLTEHEKRVGAEGFMASLGMFAFLYALLMAPDFFVESYVSPHASIILVIGFVFAIWTGVRWEYLEWRKRAAGEDRVHDIGL